MFLPHNSLSLAKNKISAEQDFSQKNYYPSRKIIASGIYSVCA